MQEVHAELRKGPDGGAGGGGRRPLVWLAGDSSLDNKYWIPGNTAEAIGGYERVLQPPVSRQDVCYCLNREFVRRRSPYRCYICRERERERERENSGGSDLTATKTKPSSLEPKT